MEAIKNAIGLGTSEQQGREPVSGVTGSGTAGEPYDQGNVEDPSLGGKAPQQTDPVSEQSTTSAAGGVAPNATSATTSTATTTTASSDPMHAHQEVPNEPVGTPAHALKGSKASIAPEKPDHANAPLKPAAKGGEHGTNPDAIPTAGGKKIGEDSYTERTSMQADSATAGVTGANTASNTGSPASGAVPQTSSSASGVDAEKESTTSGGSGSGSGSGHKKKHSLVEKIKDKVHKH